LHSILGRQRVAITRILTVAGKSHAPASKKQSQEPIPKKKEALLGKTKGEAISSKKNLHRNPRERHAPAVRRRNGAKRGTEGLEEK